MMECRGKCPQCVFNVEKPDWRKGQSRAYCSATRVPAEMKWGYLAGDGLRYMETSLGMTCDRWEAKDA